VGGGGGGGGGVKLTPTSSLVPRLISGAVPPLVSALMRCIGTSSLYLCVRQATDAKAVYYCGS